MNHLPQPNDIVISATIQDSSQMSRNAEPMSPHSSTIVPSTETSPTFNDLHRTVEIFRQSANRSSPPSRLDNSPKASGIISAPYSPIDEERIKERIAEDQWKRRAQSAESAVSEMRKELHEAGITYAEVLRRCNDEIKKVTNGLNQSLDDEQAKLRCAQAEIAVAQAESKLAREEAERLRQRSQLAISILIMIIVALLFSEFWNYKMPYCS
jgi:hypothetical protein